MVTFTIFYHQYTPNVSICTIHGSYGIGSPIDYDVFWDAAFGDSDLAVALEVRQRHEQDGGDRLLFRR